MFSTFLGVIDEHAHSSGGTMGTQTHFDKFHSRIKLGREDDAYKKARERDDSIKVAIKAAFKTAGYAVTSDFIQGSLATSTAIVPISGDYDIDRALVIDHDTAPDNPVEPKKTALSVLELRGFKNAKIKKPCVTADYSSDNVHVDFPIYKKSGQQLYLAIGKLNSNADNREWSESDPKGLIDWINNRDQYHGSASDKQSQYRRLVRYLKRWRDHQFSDSGADKVYSIGLTVMAKEHFEDSFDEEGFRQDIIALRDTVKCVLNAAYFIQTTQDRYSVQVPLPVQPWRDIFSGSSLDTGTQLRNKLINLRDKLTEAEGIDDERKQCIILNKLFGDDFEVPEPPTDPSKKARAVYPTAGAVGTSQGA